MKTKLTFIRELDSSIDREKYETYKEKMTKDNGQKTSHTIELGDHVLIKQKMINKMTPTFNPKRYTVIRKKGLW